MLSLHVRAPLARLLAPLTARLARTNLSPDVVTVVGALGVCGSALGFFTRGVFAVGTLAITAFVLFDLLDGLLARARGTSSVWGAFLDSTLDRVADGAIFGSLTMWYAGRGDSLPLAGVSLFCLVAGAVTSYSKARAESLGLRCDVGFAERAERLIIVLVAAFFYGVGVPYLLPAALWFLAAATLVTVAQRLVAVHQQAAGLPATAVPLAPSQPPGRSSTTAPPEVGG